MQTLYKITWQVQAPKQREAFESAKPHGKLFMLSVISLAVFMSNLSLCSVFHGN